MLKHAKHFLKRRITVKEKFSQTDYRNGHLAQKLKQKKNHTGVVHKSTFTTFKILIKLVCEVQTKKTKIFKETEIDSNASHMIKL